MIFYLNLINWFSFLKTLADVSWLGAYLRFFQLQKRETNDEGGGG